MMSRSPVRDRNLNSSEVTPARSLKSFATFPVDRHLVRPGKQTPPSTVSAKDFKKEKVHESSSFRGEKKLTRLLLNVNIERSIGPVHVVMSPEKTVVDLIKAALGIYEKEKRRPLLKETDPNCFQLHYSPFSLESLKNDEVLINLGSRNFFLCSNNRAKAVT